jgi:hypothetical protein
MDLLSTLTLHWARCYFTGTPTNVHKQHDQKHKLKEFSSCIRFERRQYCEILKNSIASGGQINTVPHGTPNSMSHIYGIEHLLRLLGMTITQIFFFIVGILVTQS